MNHKNSIVLFSILSFTFIGCRNNNKNTINQALAIDKYTENTGTEKIDTLLEHQYLSKSDIEREVSLVTNQNEHRKFEELSWNEWFGYWSGYYGGTISFDFPCIAYNTSSDSLLVSSPRKQVKFPKSYLSEALNVYRDELKASGYFWDLKNEEEGSLSRTIQLGSRLKYLLDGLSPERAFIYFSGIGETKFNNPLMFACDKSYGPKIRLIGPQGLNWEYEIELIDTAFTVFQNYLDVEKYQHQRIKK